MATYYKTDGSVEEKEPANGKSFTFDELKTFIDWNGENMVQMVPLPSGKVLIVNEEGKLIGADTNEKATEFWKTEYPIAEYPNNNDELVVGNALVATEKELEED